MDISGSISLYNRAIKSIPGGVNSPVRSFNSVGGNPLFFKSAKGSKLFDVDGNSYLDYVCSWGPMILGHAYEKVINNIKVYAENSTSFGAPSEVEVELAELITSLVSNIDKIRMVNSGTEACMSAVRLARGFTGRDKIIKFEGCYHGHADSFLIKAGSGAATLGTPDSPGVTKGTAMDTLNGVYNDITSVETLLDNYPDQIASIIIEPVAGNMGCIPPKPGFLEGLRELCNQNDIVLIFDEVMTGFRLALGGAQEFYGVKADLVTYGKIIGGGLPVGAYGGKEELMSKIAPEGPIYQAGTLSGNPLAMISGLTTIQELIGNTDIYNQLDINAKKLATEIGNLFSEVGISTQINQVGSMLSLFFSDVMIENYNSTREMNTELFKKFFHLMLNAGVYLPPSPYESWFLSAALTNNDIDQTLEAVKNAAKSIGESQILKA